MEDNKKVDGQSDIHKKINFQEIFYRFKKIKNIELIISIILIAIALLVYASTLGKDKKVSQTTSGNTEAGYLNDEVRLESILSTISGAGKVRVLITYDGTTELVTAIEEKINTTTREDDSGGSNLKSTTTDETTSPILITVDGKTTPMVVKELSPKIQGVIIVAEGANSIKVRLELLRAASTALNIEQNKIEIFTMNN
ncbi:MAG: hypothetical protein RR357_03945 [Clostridia bacterium]